MSDPCPCFAPGRRLLAGIVFGLGLNPACVSGQLCGPSLGISAPGAQVRTAADGDGRRMADCWQRLAQLEAGLLVTDPADGQDKTACCPSVPIAEGVGRMPTALLEAADMDTSLAEEVLAAWGAVPSSCKSMVDAAGRPNLATANGNGGANYACMRRMLCSAMLETDCFSDAVSSAYALDETEWLDEFGVTLGRPLQGLQRDPWAHGVYARLYEKGLILLNPRGNGAQTVDVTMLGAGRFKHFWGIQDPVTNNGANVTTVTLADAAGVVLVNRLRLQDLSGIVK